MTIFYLEKSNHFIKIHSTVLLFCEAVVIGMIQFLFPHSTDASVKKAKFKPSKVKFMQVNYCKFTQHDLWCKMTHFL